MQRFFVEPRRPRWVRESPRAHWYVVATVCIGAFMGQLDASIVAVALPRLGPDLHASTAAAEWIVLVYLVVLVAIVPTVGRIADGVGRKLLYVYGFGVFTIGSALCGLAPTLAVLIAARALQAVGAAMLQANSVALITEAMPRPLLGRALGIQGTAQALGLALGPAVGGLLLALGGWRLIFLVNLPAGVVAIVLAWLLVPRSRTLRSGAGADRLGAALLAVAAAGPLLYLSLATSRGYGEPALLAVLAAGAAAAVAFVRHERRVASPLVELSLLRRPVLSVGLSTALVAYTVLFGTLLVVRYHLSGDAAVVGLQLSALPVAIGIAAPVAGRLVGRVPTRWLTGGGLILAAAGLLGLAVWHDTAGVVAGLMVTGLGLGTFTPANNATVMGGSPAGHTGVVSGVLNMTRGMGTALGVSLAVSLSMGAGLPLAAASLGALSLAVGLALVLGRRGAPDARGRQVLAPASV